MAENRDPLGPAPEEVLGEADSLMSRHRPAAKPRPVDPRQATLPNIPTLTDVVSGPLRAVGDTIPPKPRKPTPQIEQVRRLEEYVFSRIKDRLDGEVDALIERRLMPGAADSMAQMVSEAADYLKAGLRDMVREAVQDALDKSVKEPKEGADADPPASPEQG
jgi:hypothetical protein